VTCYQNISAQELHDLVTRLEAHGFKFADARYMDGGVTIHGERVEPHWSWRMNPHNAVWFECKTSFAAAIIEVAARDWYGQDVFVGRRTSAARQKDGLVFAEPAPTPLHAIVAAVEAKEAK